MDAAAVSAKTQRAHDDLREDCSAPPLIEPISDRAKVSVAELLNSRNEKGSVKSSKKTLRRLQYKKVMSQQMKAPSLIGSAPKSESTEE